MLLKKTFSVYIFAAWANINVLLRSANTEYNYSKLMSVAKKGEKKKSCQNLPTYEHIS